MASRVFINPHALLNYRGYFNNLANIFPMWCRKRELNKICFITFRFGTSKNNRIRYFVSQNELRMQH